MFRSVSTSLIASAALALILSATAAVPPGVFIEGGKADSLAIDPAASQIRWRDSAGHSGRVALTRGLIVTRHEQLVETTVDVDLRAARRLVSSDTRTRPGARFVATGATRLGLAKWRVDGTLTMAGQERPVHFETNVQWVELGHLVATAELAIDPRVYGSSRDDGGDLRIAITLHAKRVLPAVASR